MSSRRFQLARVLDALGISKGLLALRARRGTAGLPVLTYHRVGEIPPGYLFDPDVIDVTPSEFDAHLKIIGRYFSVIGIDELVAHFAGVPLPPNPLMITFDDGYADNYHAALPILQRHGLKATFFITTDFIEDRRIFWWDRISYLFNKTKVQTLKLSFPTALEFDLEQEKDQAVKTLVTLIKEQYALDTERLLVELAQALDVAWDTEIETALADELLMTWSQVKALQDGGMDVESHTRSHRVLYNLSAAELEEELVGAKTKLEAVLSKEIRAITYPVGRSMAALPAIYDAVRNAGYALGFTNASGLNADRKNIDPYDIRRLAMDPGLPTYFVRGMLALPQLGYSSQ